MKTLFFGTALALSALFVQPCIAAESKQLSELKPEELKDVYFICKTNKSPLSYQPGEEMVYTITLHTGNDKPGNWTLSYIRQGDDNKKFSGSAPADNGSSGADGCK